jgi:integrase
MFYHFGLRRGEALGIKCQDILHRDGLVQVLRRPDDPEDPRIRNPARQKTRERIIPCGSGLMRNIVEYIDLSRDLFPLARQHNYLFCSHSGRTQGMPLSLDSPGKILERIPHLAGMPGKLHPHLLRHAWNATFSRLVDRIGSDKEEARALRSYLMGWSPRSDVASSYDVRHLREAAERLSLLWQEMIPTAKL